LSEPVIPAAHPSELELHGHAIGALGDEHSERVRRHATACPDCSRTLAAISAADDPLTRRAGPRAGRRALIWTLALAVPAAAIAVVVPRLGGSPPDDLQAKGGDGRPALEIFARRGAHPFRVGADTPLRSGDEIRFVVHRPEGLSHVMIASVEESGATNLYFPFGAAGSGEVAGAGGRAELPGAIVLDASRGPERVFALFSRAPLPWVQAQRALATLGQRGAAEVRRPQPLPIPAEAQASLLLEKE
jgi:hypothetical protein